MRPESTQSGPEDIDLLRFRKRVAGKVSVSGPTHRRTRPTARHTRAGADGWNQLYRGC
ncbi:hypothetical protein J6590_021673 [Homalodisca vitripennis]|nr:hypothetical protein J6590_021673 [Homalodisca vitripennis]